MPELYNKIGESLHCSTIQGNTELHEFVLLRLHCLQEEGAMPSDLQLHFRMLTLSNQIFLPTAYSPSSYLFWAVKRLVDYL
jgi:hypothetical protein